MFELVTEQVFYPKLLLNL